MKPRFPGRDARQERKEEVNLESWSPKTELGKKVKAGEVIDLSQILRHAHKIFEPEITDKLLPELESDLINIGQSKGKFGGGRRRALRQTQKKTKDGSKLHFTATAVVGNKNGYVGLGTGTSRETVPAREKAMRNAKINVLEIMRGCGSWECTCGKPHSIPFAVKGRKGSVRVKLMPAPKGTGLACEKELRKVLMLAGIKDVWSEVRGQCRQKLNLMAAVEKALLQLSRRKLRGNDESKVTKGRLTS